jgi:class 3 adenylate cyclase/tetratricopeptide (TPR) repeat protein
VNCPQCGAENRPDARFCDSCGAPLAAEPAPAREERKVVTVLFCDLVGSTARAEGADPEDVRALLSAYHERVRSELERFGGTVEKFIGDAVMALFGAPVAHEDDPERSVRAALAIREWATDEGDLQVRIGITTGEALVALGARPEAGEGMASGDVVNTAARLQSAAPANGIVVDEITYRATSNAIDYRELAAVEAKGKAEPVPVREVVQARARFGVDVAQRGGAELVGRRRELALLREALARVREEREAQLVTLVGVPGIGKSRLVYELFREIERGNELTYWRQGRALPYGEGVTFWPLVEIAKAHAGILETDTAEAADEKLGRAVREALGDDPEADWVEGHLRPLVGLEAEAKLGGDRRGEAFAAWRRLFEALAERRPLVVVFEDLQWADEGMLDFVDHLVEWASGVPLLVVSGTRPELLERRPGWGAGKPNSAIVSLAPLSDEDTARLVHALLEQAVLPAEVQRALLARAGGNPLYAEEFVRMAAEVGDERELPLPESVQGLIAARLDLLSNEEKSLLQNAAVVGQVFWLGAMAALDGSERRSLEQLLHVLERKDFLRRARRSSVAGETEYAFRHILVRDVAYAQIPRGARAEKHRLAAEWIEGLSPDRSEDRAEMLAHHYLSALELARAAGQETADLAESARLALRDAGDRALTLNAFAVAVRFFSAALELWPDEDRERPQLLLGYGRALWVAEGKGEAELVEARDGLLAAGDREAAAEAGVLLSLIEWHRGHRDRCFDHLDRAAELLRDLGPSRAKAYVMAHLSRTRVIAGHLDEALRYGREALEIAEHLGLDEIRAHALDNIGLTRVQLGDQEGIADLERSVEIALAANSTEATRAYNNLAVCYWQLGDLARSRPIAAEAVRAAERVGDIVQARFTRAWRAGADTTEGRWDEALRQAEEIIARADGGHQESGGLRGRARIRLARDDVEGALGDATRALALSQEVKDPQSRVPALVLYAWLTMETGRRRDAARAVDELLELVRAERYWLTYDLPGIAFVFTALGRTQVLYELLEATLPSRWSEAALLYAGGERGGAADVLAAMGALAEEASCRLRAAEALIAAGDRAGGDEQLQKALAFWRSVGATRYIREGEKLLAKTA